MPPLESSAFSQHPPITFWKTDGHAARSVDTDVPMNFVAGAGVLFLGRRHPRSVRVAVERPGTFAWQELSNGPTRRLHRRDCRHCHLRSVIEMINSCERVGPHAADAILHALHQPDREWLQAVSPGESCGCSHTTRRPLTDRNGRRPSIPATFQESFRVAHVTSDILDQVPIDAIPELTARIQRLSLPGGNREPQDQVCLQLSALPYRGRIVQPIFLPLLRGSLVLGVRATGAVTIALRSGHLNSPTGSPRRPITRPAADPACLRVRTLPIAIVDRYRPHRFQIQFCLR